MLDPAEVQWRDAQPYSTKFADIYYTGDGLDEVARVFLHPSRIEERARASGLLTIGELGFGSGLNFTVCAERFLANPQARLHFISFEKHPMGAKEWERLRRVRQSNQLFDELAAIPLPILPGWHRRSFKNGHITLSVFHGDVVEGLVDLSERQATGVDAWFLDGFAPSKNPAMWTQRVFDLMANCSANDATVATFTAAGADRRGLSEAGFEMHRVDQRPVKRESLAGAFRARGKPDVSVPNQVTVYGAGIAGCNVARQLAQQNIQVSVHDPNGAAQGASRMNATLLHGRLLGDASVDAEFRCASYHYAIGDHLQFAGFQPTGVLQAQGPNLDQRKILRIVDAYPHSTSWLQRVSEVEANKIAGVAVRGESIWFAHGGIVDLPQICDELLQHPNIELVSGLGQDHLQAPYVVACATAARDFPHCRALEIVDVYGQLDWVNTSRSPSVPIVGNGYIVPTREGCVIGSTYEYSQWDPALAREHNRQLNAHYLSESEVSESDVSESDLEFSAFKRAPRSIASDRIPVVGRLIDGNWISTAHASLGTASAPLGAAIVSSQILGWVPPVSSAVERLLHPGRFAERQRRRGVRHISPRSLAH